MVKSNSIRAVATVQFVPSSYSNAGGYSVGGFSFRSILDALAVARSLNRTLRNGVQA